MSTLDELQREKAQLENDLGVAIQRKHAATSDAGKIVIQELADALERRRRGYKSISTNQRANVVLAQLAELQGKEEEIEQQIAMWTNSENRHETLDLALKRCNKRIIDIVKSKSTRRL